MNQKRQLPTTFTWVLLVVLASGLIVQGMAVAQSDDAQAKPAAKKSTAKVRGRLPAFYGRVVSGSQREKIYKIQQGYAAEIAELTKKLAELRERQGNEIKAVLTPEQIVKIEDLAVKAKAKRAKAKAARSAK